MKLDYWSLGVIIYEMICGKSPFRAKNPEASFQKILKGKVLWNTPVPSDAQDLILKLLQVQPEMRIKGDDIKSHCFFQGFDWDMLEEKLIEPPIKPNFTHEIDLSYFRTVGEDSDSEASHVSHPNSYYDDFSFNAVFT